MENDNYYAYMVKTMLDILKEQEEEEIIEKIYKKTLKVIEKNKKVEVRTKAYDKYIDEFL